MCDSSLELSVEQDLLTVSITPTSLLIQQSADYYTTTVFQSLVENVMYNAGTVSPGESYQTVLMVTVSDGELVNQPPAFSFIQVNEINEAPQVFLNGEVL